MIAYVGLPGSQHFIYKFFQDGRTKAAHERARAWYDKHQDWGLDTAPGFWGTPDARLHVISNKEARKWRWRDGRHVFPEVHLPRIPDVQIRKPQ